MEFLESFEKISNRIRSFKDVNKNKFFIDISYGTQHEWSTLWNIETIFKNNKTDIYAIQCGCGRLDVISEKIFNKAHKLIITTDNPSLLCSSCLNFNIEFVSDLDATPEMKQGLNELGAMLDRAQNDNYMTLCYFLWLSISIESEQLNESENSVAIIFDQYMKNNMEVFLGGKGLSPYKMNRKYHENRQYILCLLALNHIIEIDGLYDLIVSLGAIAECEQYLIGDDGNSIHPVGLKFVKSVDDKRDTVKFKISSLKKWLRERKMMKLARLIQIAFNYELRNAFAHSEYSLTEEGVYLTRYNRTVPYGKLQDSFLAAYYLLRTVSSWITKQRMDFIKSGGYEENGWKIEPIIEGNGMSVRISGSGVGEKPIRKKPKFTKQ